MVNLGDLGDLSVEEMQAMSLRLQEKIKQSQEEATKATKPKPLADPDFGPIVRLCQDYIDELAETGYADENYDHWAFETATIAVFGNDVRKWTNKILRGE